MSTRSQPDCNERSARCHFAASHKAKTFGNTTAPIFETTYLTITMASANNRVMEDIDHDQATQTTAATGAEAYIEQRNLDRIEIEGNLVALTAKVEKRLKMPMSRVVLGSATGSGPNISSPFQSILSSQNSGALSAAAKEAMEQLDRVLNTSMFSSLRHLLFLGG